MALRTLVFALGFIAAASPVAASRHPPGTPAPAGTPDTLYCMHIEAITGSRLEKVKCWTRSEWADRGVDVDEDWATEGVSVIG